MFAGTGLAILIALAVVVALIVGVTRFRGGKLRRKICARCGAFAQHGHSQKAESDLKDIVPLCLSCLLAQLEQDYSIYRGRAVVIQPVAEFPCYVFRDRGYLQRISQSQDLDHEIHELLARVGTCGACGGTAHYLWIESHGLNDKTFETCLNGGLAKPLLAWGNPPPVSLCGGCSVKRIGAVLRDKRFSYIEVCSLHGTEEGVVMPIGY
jgi:hypothetical protein